MPPLPFVEDPQNTVYSGSIKKTSQSAFQGISSCLCWEQPPCQLIMEAHVRPGNPIDSTLGPYTKYSCGVYGKRDTFEFSTAQVSNRLNERGGNHRKKRQHFKPKAAFVSALCLHWMTWRGHVLLIGISLWDIPHVSNSMVVYVCQTCRLPKMPANNWLLTGLH